MQQQRLFEIVWLLTEKGGATADELAERFGVSRRTIYRDIDALSGAGIPVYAQQGKGGGIRLLPDFVLDKTLFSKDEQAQLAAHLDSLKTLGTPDTQPLLDKLAALFGRQEASWLEVDFAPWDGGDAMRQLLALLRDAILARRTLRFTYSGQSGKSEERTVYPCKVVFRGQGWYLHAFCTTRSAFRYFKLNRMRNVVETGGSYEPMEAPPAALPAEGAATQQVILKIAPAAAFRVLDEFAPGQVSQHRDGSYLVKARLPSEGNWLMGYLLSYGADAEVMAPLQLRRQVAATLKKMQGQYR